MTFLHSHTTLTLKLLVPKLTTCETSQALKWETIFFYKGFSSLSPCIKVIPHWAPADSSFLGASDVSRLQMYHTNVLFGAPNQGQTLDMWESQPAESALRCMCHSTQRGHHLSLGSISWLPQDIPIGIHADILDHTYWNWGKIHFNDCPIHRISYSMWLCSELVRYATSVLWA